MPAHIACRPAAFPDADASGCFVVCAEHGIRQSFGSAHPVARAACIEHNAIHHPAQRRRTAQILSLIYESRSAPGFETVDLEALLADARQRNRAFGVTGMLLAEDGWFLQALEGPEAIVERLMGRIRLDPRHEHVRVLSREVRRERRFPDWDMAEGHIGTIETLPLAQYYEGFLVARGRSLLEKTSAERRATPSDASEPASGEGVHALG